MMFTKLDLKASSLIRSHFSLSAPHKDDSGADVRAHEVIFLDHEVLGDLGDGFGDLPFGVLADHDVLVLADAGLPALHLEVHSLRHPGDAAHVPLELFIQLVGDVIREDLAVRADSPVAAGLRMDRDILVVIVG